MKSCSNHLPLLLIICREPQAYTAWHKRHFQKSKQYTWGGSNAITSGKNERLHFSLHLFHELTKLHTAKILSRIR